MVAESTTIGQEWGRNIAEKKRAEAEIARKNEDLQQLIDRVRELDRVKSDFSPTSAMNCERRLHLLSGPPSLSSRRART